MIEILGDKINWRVSICVCYLAKYSFLWVICFFLLGPPKVVLRFSSLSVHWCGILLAELLNFQHFKFYAEETSFGNQWMYKWKKFSRNSEHQKWSNFYRNFNSFKNCSEWHHLRPFSTSSTTSMLSNWTKRFSATDASLSTNSWLLPTTRSYVKIV